MDTKDVVLVTGTSSGIGLATARILVGRGFVVFGGVRTEADGDRVRTELGDRFRPLVLDVTSDADVANAVTSVTDYLTNEGARLAGLVNNAGITRTGPVEFLHLDDFRAVFEVDVFGVLQVTKAFLPLLGTAPSHAGPPGRIVNVGSVCGRLVPPFAAPYAMAKHALEALSDSLRRELVPYGIDVVLLEPAGIRTPMWDKIADRDESAWAGSVYEPVLRRTRSQSAGAQDDRLDPAQVAAVVVRALTARRPRTRYVVTSRFFSGWFLPRLLPDRWHDWLIARWLGWRR